MATLQPVQIPLCQHGTALFPCVSQTKGLVQLIHSLLLFQSVVAVLNFEIEENALELHADSQKLIHHIEQLLRVFL